MPFISSALNCWIMSARFASRSFSGTPNEEWAHIQLYTKKEVFRFDFKPSSLTPSHPPHPKAFWLHSFQTSCSHKWRRLSDTKMSSENNFADILTECSSHHQHSVETLAKLFSKFKLVSDNLLHSISFMQEPTKKLMKMQPKSWRGNKAIVIYIGHYDVIWWIVEKSGCYLKFCKIIWRYYFHAATFQSNAGLSQSMLFFHIQLYT